MKNTSKRSCLLIAGILATTLTTQAAVITVNGSAPVADNDDIYSFAATGGTVTGQSLDDYTSPSDGAPDVNSLWKDRGAQGQSFTTGSNALGYTLDAFSFKTRGNVVSAPFITFRLGTLSLSLSGSDSVFTEIASARVMPSTTQTSGDWLTASFDSTYVLDDNTVYAIDFQNTEVESWIGFYLDGDVDSSYTGGSAYTSGLKGQGLNDTDLSLPQIDRAFHVNLVAVPEPETFALIGGCLALGYVMLRRRR